MNSFPCPHVPGIFCKHIYMVHTKHPVNDVFNAFVWIGGANIEVYDFIKASGYMWTGPKFVLHYHFKIFHDILGFQSQMSDIGWNPFTSKPDGGCFKLCQKLEKYRWVGTNLTQTARSSYSNVQLIKICEITTRPFHRGNLWWKWARGNSHFTFVQLQ